MKKTKYELEAENELKTYAEEMTSEWASEMDKYISMDEDAAENFEKYGKCRYVKPQKRILRYVAIFIAVIFAGSIVIPIPQVNAWQVWWLDLLFEEHEESIDITSPDGDNFKRYNVKNIPKGFNLADELSLMPGSYTIYYENDSDEFIEFSQAEKSGAAMHIDNENREKRVEMVGDYEVFISEGIEDMVYIFTTEDILMSIHTNASEEVIYEFINNIEKCD